MHDVLMVDEIHRPFQKQMTTKPVTKEEKDEEILLPTEEYAFNVTVVLTTNDNWPTPAFLKKLEKLGVTLQKIERSPDMELHF